MIKWFIVSVAISLSITCLTGSVQAGAGEWIVGSLSIRNDAGQNIYGERLAVFLVQKQSPVSAEHCLDETDLQRRMDCLNNCHLDFYKKFQQNLQQDDYLIDQTTSSETGNFAFLSPPVGTFYVLVKFPSMIDGYKVAWQEPVVVSAGQIRVVTLNEENLVFPKHRRR
jgi:hypothetical protein